MVRKGESPSIEYRKKISDALRGRPLSKKHRLAISRGGKGVTRSAHYDNPKEHGKGVCGHWGHVHNEETRVKIAQARYKATKYKNTWLEKALENLLLCSGFIFEQQKRFGRYTVDAWVSSHGLVFEADGTFWHQDTKREKERDAYLVQKGVLAVIHLTEKDLYKCRRLSI